MTDNPAVHLLTSALKNLQTRDLADIKEPVLRLETIIDNLDLLSWLEVNHRQPRFYFSGRDAHDDVTAGLGVADEVFQTSSSDYPAAFAHMRAHLRADEPHLKYYGGFAFAPGHVDDDWQSFGACRLVIPRFELRFNESENKSYLACNLKPATDSIADIIEQLQGLVFEPAVNFSAPGQPVSRTDFPDHLQWVKNLTQAIDEIKSGLYLKTVLARKAELVFADKPNPLALLSFLTHLPSKRYDFMFQFEADSAFLGSSPERLFKRDGRALLSEAVAGTRTRGQLEQDDILLAQELMDSDKEQREHDFVIKTIEEELIPLCLSMEVEQKKGLLKLKEGQHLITHLSAVLKEGVSDDQLLGIMHPTPAVGGCPLKNALAAIEGSEPFKRGWYAGVIGSIGFDCSDLAVGLRCARTYGYCLSLYSGVGVVQGSVPEEEWIEVEGKIVNFMDIIGGKLF